MATQDKHPLIEFANRYGDPTQDYLNAYIALARLEALLEDAEKVSTLLNENEPVSQRWFPWFGAEVISYYSVGFVTCLEWHAKSRLNDLLTHSPSSLKIEDFKGSISDKLIVQMVAQRGSVIQLVGAAAKVGSFDKYLSIFNRIFIEFGIPFSASDWLFGNTPASNVCWIKPNQIEVIEYVFNFRHQLVHEIGMAAMGHNNIRDAWSPDEVKSYGALFTAVIHGIEAAMTQFAPALFPNLLNNERHPIFYTDTLKNEFIRLDNRANELIKSNEWNDTDTYKAWEKARNAFQTYLEQEENFIATADMLHWRYFDARTPLRTRLLNYRIGFISELISNFASAIDDNPDGTGSGTIEVNE